jgi:hypothetical protein
VRFQVLTAAVMKTAALWDVAPCSPVEIDYSFRSAYCLMMEAANTCETSVSFCQSTRRNIRKEGHLHTRRHENLKFHLLGLYLYSTWMYLWHSACGSNKPQSCLKSRICVWHVQSRLYDRMVQSHRCRTGMSKSVCSVGRLRRGDFWGTSHGRGKS